MASKVFRKWSEALAHPTEVEALRFDAKQLPRVKWPRPKALPAEIGAFVNLRSLGIRGTQLGALCPELGTLPLLEELSIDNTDFELEIGSVLAGLPSLRSLELNNVGLTGFVPLPERLERLSLEANDRLDLESWFAGLAALPRLHTLTLSRACPTVPAAIEALPVLRSLVLAQNGYHEVPAAVLALEALEHLDLTDNRPTTLPDRLGALRALEGLRLGSNPLTELPEWIGELKRLRTLDLSLVPLHDLPPRLADLPLEHLWVDVPAEVLAELQRRMPRCRVVSRTTADVEREVAGWLRFLGKA